MDEEKGEQMSDKRALRPCPWCGELPVVEEWSRGVVVVHRDCRAGINSFSDSPNGDGFGSYGKDEASAIEAWNTRAERTCHPTTGKFESFDYCSACGAMLTRYVEPGRAAYCPGCGAKVVDA